MGMGNGGGRPERDRLLGKPLELFTVNTSQGARTISVPMLPAAVCIDWTVFYERAIDLNTDLTNDAGYYENKGPHDWGHRMACPACEGLNQEHVQACETCKGARIVFKDAYPSKEAWRTAFSERKRAVFAAFCEAFWQYGQMCVSVFGGADPLLPELTRDALVPAQIMDAVTRMQRVTDPLKCWETSVLQRAVDQKDQLLPSGTAQPTGSGR